MEFHSCNQKSEIEQKEKAEEEKRIGAGGHRSTSGKIGEWRG